MKVKISVIQMKVELIKETNLKKAYDFIKKCGETGTDFVVLPEMFNCPYNNKYFPEFAEETSGSETLKMLSVAAKENNVYIIGGSIPEKAENKIFNTSFIFSPDGEIIGRHRKMHLFDIDVPGKIRFMESEVLTPGEDITIVDTKYGKIGVCICYDIRFPELTRLMALEGVKMVFVPGAFNMTTGPAHWELLFRSRALDNQIFMIGASPARDESFSYIAYGNSIITNPWGEIVNRMDEKEGIMFNEVELEDIDKYRESMPYFRHRRTDIYNLRKLK